MKVRGPLLLCLILLLAGCSQTTTRTARARATRAHTTSAATTTRPVVARVIDEAGNAVAGAKVTAAIVCDNEKLIVGPSGLSDQTGEVFLDPFPFVAKRYERSTLTLVASKGNARVGLVPTSLATSEDGGFYYPYGHSGPPVQVVKLQKLKARKGLVVDENGRPIAGVTVTPRVNWYSLSINKVAGLKPGMTDSAGRFVLPLCPADSQGIRPEYSKKGYAVSKHAMGGGRVVMEHAGSICGRLVDKEGGPLAGLDLLLDGPSDALVTARRDGRFTGADLIAGEYAIVLPQNDSGYLMKPRCGVVVQKNRTAEVGNVVTARGVVVSGRVVDAATGKPVERNVGAWPESYNSRGISTRNSPRTFRLRLLPGETYIVYPFQYGIDYNARRDSRKMIIPRDGLKGLVIKADTTGRAMGRILDETGRPLRNGAIFMPGLAKSTRFGVFGQGGTLLDGWFELPLAPRDQLHDTPDEVPLIVRDPLRRVEYRQNVDCDALLQGDVTVRMKPTMVLTVQVLDRQTRKPVKDAYVYYNNFWAKTDGSGKARFKSNVRHGNCSVDVYKAYGRSHAHSTVTLPDPTSKESSDTVTVLMEPPAGR